MYKLNKMVHINKVVNIIYIENINYILVVLSQTIITALSSYIYLKQAFVLICLEHQLPEWRQFFKIKMNEFNECGVDETKRKYVRERWEKTETDRPRKRDTEKNYELHVRNCWDSGPMQNNSQFLEAMCKYSIERNHHGSTEAFFIILWFPLFLTHLIWYLICIIIDLLNVHFLNITSFHM